MNDHHITLEESIRSVRDAWHTMITLAVSILPPW
jgi:hypothetical protein